MSVETVNTLISLGTIALQGALLIAALLFVLGKKKVLVNTIGSRGMEIAYAFAFAGMLGSLYYSEIALYAPCVLCWYQRIFMYSGVFVLGYALFKRDVAGISYAMLLSVVGTIIAVYQVLLPLLPEASATCSPVSSVSCSETYFTMFGYITIPVISLTTWIAMIFVLHLAKQYVRTK